MLQDNSKRMRHAVTAGKSALLSVQADESKSLEKALSEESMMEDALDRNTGRGAPPTLTARSWKKVGGVRWVHEEWEMTGSSDSTGYHSRASTEEEN